MYYSKVKPVLCLDDEANSQATYMDWYSSIFPRLDMTRISCVMPLEADKNDKLRTNTMTSSKYCTYIVKYIYFHQDAQESVKYWRAFTNQNQSKHLLTPSILDLKFQPCVLFKEHLWHIGFLCLLSLENMGVGKERPKYSFLFFLKLYFQALRIYKVRHNGVKFLFAYLIVGRLQQTKASFVKIFLHSLGSDCVWWFTSVFWWKPFLLDIITLLAGVQMPYFPVSISRLLHSTVRQGVPRVVWVHTKVEVIGRMRQGKLLINKQVNEQINKPQGIWLLLTGPDSSSHKISHECLATLQENEANNRSNASGSQKTIAIASLLQDYESCYTSALT